MGADARRAADGPAAQQDRELRLAEVLERCLADVRKGKAHDRQRLLAEHEDLAAELGAALDALRFVERGVQIEAGADPEPAPPEVRELGDFRIVKEIGRGGMGVVYEAEQLSLARRVALKVLPFAAVLDSVQLQRFKNEAQAAAHLHHTNIVPVYSVGCDRGVHYYAMPFIEGQTVAALVRDLKALRSSGPPSPLSSGAALRAITKGHTTESPAFCRSVAELGVQATFALDHAHQQGVIHRDIKPANLIVDINGSVWITDFGLASFRSAAGPALTLTGDLLGTVRYMSPEQALAKRVPVDHRTDIYSLGLTLYELLTLEAAFPGDNPHEILREIAFKEPRPPSRLNRAVAPEMETILLKAMAKDPEARYATAKEMAEDLQRFLEDKPIRARRPSLLDRGAKWARRHRTVVGSAVLLLVLSTTGLAVGAALLAREKSRTEENYRIADAQRRQAEANLAKAVEAVDRMLTRVGHVALADVPHMEPVRKALLRDAVEFYEGFLERHGGAGVAVATIDAYRRLGEIHLLLGDLAAAERALDRGDALAAELLRDDPALTPALHWRLHLSTVRADMLKQAGKGSEAQAAFEAAADLGERITAAEPGNREFRRDLGNALLNLAMLHVDHGRTAEAEAILLRSRHRLEPLASQLPHDLMAQEDLAGTLSGLARVLRLRGRRSEAETALRDCLRVCRSFRGEAVEDSYLRTAEPGALEDLGVILEEAGRWAEAETALREAMALRLRQADAAPNQRQTHENAAKSCWQLGLFLFRAGRVDEAEEACRRTIEIYEKLTRDFPGILSLQRELVAHLSHLGGNLAQASRPEAALGALRRAVELGRELVATAPVPVHRKKLADALNNLGMQAGAAADGRPLLLEAAGLYDELAAEAPDVPEYRFEMAAALTNLASIFSDGGNLEEATRHNERAAQTLAGLGAEFPENVTYRQRLATVYFNLGEDHRRANRLDDARRVLSEALAIMDQLVAELPGSHPDRWDRVDVLEKLGEVEEGADAERHFREALRILEEGVASFPAKRRQLAKVAFKLGNRCRRAGRDAEAEPSYRRAIELLDELSRDEPSDPDLREGLSQSLACLAMSLAAMGNPAEVETWRRYLEVRAGLPAPLHPSHRRFLLYSKWSFAGDAGRNGRPEEAESLFREAIDLVRPWAAEDPAGYRHELTKLLNRLASLLHQRKPEEADQIFGEAVRLAEEVFKEAPGFRGELCGVLWNQALLHRAGGREADEARNYLRILELDARLFCARANLALLRAESKDPAVRDPNAAVELALETTRLEPENGTAWSLLAHTQCRDGAWAESLAAGDRTMALKKGGDADDWILAAIACAHLGRRDEALAWYEKAAAWIDAHGADDGGRARRREAAHLLGVVAPSD